MQDSEAETMKQVDALLDSKAVDDDQLVAVDGVDLGSHLDVFHSILKQVTVSTSLLSSNTIEYRILVFYSAPA